MSEPTVSAQQRSVCPKGMTDHAACFAPFRYCPVKGCGRTEEDTTPPVPEVEDHPAFVGTCDLGNCDRPTTVVLLMGDEWLSACRPCAARQIVDHAPSEGRPAPDTSWMKRVNVRRAGHPRPWWRRARGES